MFFLGLFHAAGVQRVQLHAVQAREIVLPLAWDDPPGEWTIRLTDLFSAEAEIALTVQVK